MEMAYYFKVFAHINSSNEDFALRLKNDIRKFFSSAYEGETGRLEGLREESETKDGFDEFVFEIDGTFSGNVASLINDEMVKINTLSDGSYGMLMSDSDAGVSYIESYGMAMFSEVSVENCMDYKWTTNDVLAVRGDVDLKTLSLALKCENDINEIIDTLDEKAEDKVDKIIPKPLLKALTEEFYWEGSGEGESFSSIGLNYEYSGHEFTTEDLLQIQKAFEKKSMSCWDVFLKHDRENGEANLMLSPENNAYVSFDSDVGYCDDIRVFRLVPEGQNG
ncbi:MAG: hypothetical protein II399_01680 [Lachnospiraceae bacterium]|nr:hypothetical protein [Lachnospiraceae bacterium]